MKANPITIDLDQQVEHQHRRVAKGMIAQIASAYDLKSNQLFGLTQKLDYQTSTIVTSDGWKRKCGGAPRGGLVILRLDPEAIEPDDRVRADRLILARILDQVSTPVESSEQATLFEVHRLQVPLDVITKQRMQMSCLTLSILGTYYDSSSGKIDFGSDVDSYFAPMFYAAFIPTYEHLEKLINASVDPQSAISIGVIRYTETPSSTLVPSVPIKIDPNDLIGTRNDAQRTAILGKTRQGKSTIVKNLSQSIFASKLNVGQLFIDPSGEYTYYNAQDGTSLYLLNRKKSVRYALKPRVLSSEEKQLGLAPPDPLAINFYKHPDVGHNLINTFWSSEQSQKPGYLQPILNWSPAPLSSVPDKASDASAFNHYWRTMAMYFALLYKAGFEPSSPANLVPIDFRADVKTQLMNLVSGVRILNSSFAIEQPISVLPELFRTVAGLWAGGQNKNLFPSAKDGSPYFNDVEQNLLRCLSDSSLTAHKYLIPFRVYHHSGGSSVFTEIVDHLLKGVSVFVDFSLANEVLFQNCAGQLLQELVWRQQKLFSELPSEQRLVALYLEEAQKLFIKKENNPNNIYNILAREGAKFNIAMIYVTQSLTTISTDLTSMTDNFFVMHLDDIRETNALSNKPLFRDIASLVERTHTKGYGLMKTRSQWFVLPVQIDKFSAEWAQRLLDKSYGL